MSPNLAFLFRLVVIRFYQENAGLFLFLFLLFFGVIPPQYLIQTHFSLIKAQISSPMLALGVAVMWIIYLIKCLRFMDQTFGSYRDEFIHLYQGITKNRNIRNLGICLLTMYLPVLCYTSWVLAVAIYGRVYWYTLGLSVCTITGGLLGIRSALRSLLHPEGPNTWGTVFNFLDWGNYGSTISMRFIPLAYLWSEKRIGLMALKFFTYLSFNLFFTRNAAIFREDYFTFFIFFAGTTHALLIFNLHQMTEVKLAFLRNLPLSMLQRTVMVLITAVTLFLPELIMMLVSGHQLLSITQSLLMYGILTSQFVLLFVMLYSSNLDLKKYAQYLLLLLLSYIFLYLLLPTPLIIVFNLGMSFLIFHEQYHNYEYDKTG